MKCTQTALTFNLLPLSFSTLEDLVTNPAKYGRNLLKMINNDACGYMAKRYAEVQDEIQSMTVDIGKKLNHTSTLKCTLKM